jgi:hypothetical protein
MKKLSLMLILGTILIFAGSAQSRSDFDADVDFSITLKKLNQLLSKDQSGTVPTQKIVILSGTVSDIAILSDKHDAYTVEITLTGGEWVSPEQVKSYQVRVRFTGAEFETLFKTQQVKINSSVLVAAKIISTTATREGTRIWLLNGFHIRTLEE